MFLLFNKLFAKEINVNFGEMMNFRIILLFLIFNMLSTEITVSFYLYIFAI